MHVALFIDTIVLASTAICSLISSAHMSYTPTVVPSNIPSYTPTMYPTIMPSLSPSTRPTVLSGTCAVLSNCVLSCSNGLLYDLSTVAVAGGQQIFYTQGALDTSGWHPGVIMYYDLSIPICGTVPSDSNFLSPKCVDGNTAPSFSAGISWQSRKITSSPPTCYGGWINLGVYDATSWTFGHDSSGLFYLSYAATAAPGLPACSNGVFRHSQVFLQCGADATTSVTPAEASTCFRKFTS